MTTPTVRFVQFSDVHLDSSVGGALELPTDKRATLRQDIASSFARACALAREVRADLVLIPGDLFDFETVSPETAALAADLLRSISPTPVFIAPGNHDSLWPGSPYTDPNGTRWPDNVHIFTNGSFDTVNMGEISCSVTGIGHAHRGVTQRLLAHPVQTQRQATSILLFHGSREAYLPAGKETVIPFSDNELIAQGFRYAAIGHYHSMARICDEAGALKGAYSGCVQGRDTGETGEKCVIVGEIGPDGRVVIEAREVAQRRVVSVDVDVTGARDKSALCGRIEQVIVASGARECDVVSVSLYGSAAATLEVDHSIADAFGQFFHVHVRAAKVTPDYDLHALAEDSAAPSLKSAFVRRMLELRKEAGDGPERKALEDAIYYGLYAMDGRKLEPRDAS